MPRTPSNVPLGNRAPGFAGGFLRLRVAMRFGSTLSGFFRNQQNRVYLKTVNTPKQWVFSTCWAPFFLAIRRVFLQKNGFIRRKIPRRLSYSRFSDRP